MGKWWKPVFKVILSMVALLGSTGSFLEWLGIRPRDLAMMHSLPRVLWLVLAIVLFAVGVGLSVWVGFIQHSRSKEKEQSLIDLHKDELRRTRNSYESDLDRSRRMYDGCKEDKNIAIAKAEEAKAQLSIFTPLQLEAFQLALDFGRFLKDIGPAPEFNAELQDGTAEGVAKALMEYQGRLDPWEQKAETGYELRFAPRVRRVILGFKETGSTEPHMERLLQSPLPREEFLRIPHFLRCLAIGEQQQG